MDEPPQTRFDINSLKNRLTLDGAGKNGAGNQVGSLLGIGYGIQVAEDFFGRERWRGRILFGAFFGRHDWKGKRQAEFDAFFEKFANFAEGIALGLPFRCVLREVRELWPREHRLLRCHREAFPAVEYAGCDTVCNGRLP